MKKIELTDINENVVKLSIPGFSENKVRIHIDENGEYLKVTCKSEDVQKYEFDDTSKNLEYSIKMNGADYIRSMCLDGVCIIKFTGVVDKKREQQEELFQTMEYLKELIDEVVDGDQEYTNQMRVLLQNNFGKYLGTQVEGVDNDTKDTKDTEDVKDLNEDKVFHYPPESDAEQQDASVQEMFDMNTLSSIFDDLFGTIINKQNKGKK